MRNNRSENVAEHSYFTSLTAHALVIIANSLFGENIDADKAAAIALYHESAEVITGDLPTPIKYYNEEMRTAYKKIESCAEQQILEQLPSNLIGGFKDYVKADKDSKEYIYVKYADKLTALIKCIEESASGNSEFKAAQQTIQNELKSFNNNAVNYFMENFLEAFYMCLDEITE